MRSGILIHNEAAGRPTPEGLLDALVAELHRGGWALAPVPTSAPGHATELAREAAVSGVDGVFALGGDGTLREAAAGLLGTGVPLGLLPGGTTNVLTMALGLPLDPLAVARGVRDLTPQAMDVGLCGGQPFLMMASTGLDGHVLSRVDPAVKRRFGKLHIGLLGLWEWWFYQYPELVVEADGESFEASFAAICNIPLYAGRFELAPEARWNDERLELVLFHGRGRRATLDFVRSLLRGDHLERRDVTCRTVERVLLRPRTPDEEGAEPEPGAVGRAVDKALPETPCAPIQLDGDLCPEAPPVEVTLSEERLLVLAPEAP